MKKQTTDICLVFVVIYNYFIFFFLVCVFENIQYNNWDGLVKVTQISFQASLTLVLLVDNQLILVSMEMSYTFHILSDILEIAVPAIGESY